MDPEVGRFWDAIKLPPQKWNLSPYGDLGGGFWVVGLIGSKVVWYNDIEDGFNVSAYATFGAIAEYWCNQSELEITVQQLLYAVQTGSSMVGRASPPREGPGRAT